ncbi:MAG: class I SAM-dependent methyltransferase [Bacteroidota bacterium]
MPSNSDPIGFAIQTYLKTKKPLDILVHCDLCDDDIIPSEVLFRAYDLMPEPEKIALSKSKGKILDVGAGAGVHSLELIKRGFDVVAIDISAGAVEYMISVGINAKKSSFLNFKNEKFDTILMLMNGIGVAGKLSNLKRTLEHAKQLLNKGGSIYCDSSDVKYLYEEEDGSYWMDLVSEYYGNFRFQLSFKQVKSTWFDWLYVDYDSLHEIAVNVGFTTRKIYEKDNHYLAELTL